LEIRGYHHTSLGIVREFYWKNEQYKQKSVFSVIILKGGKNSLNFGKITLFWVILSVSALQSIIVSFIKVY